MMNMSNNYNDLVADYNKLEDASMAEKKAIASKYNIDSKKAKEIQMRILELLRDERNTRKTFTDEDMQWFNRLSDSPSLYKKAKEFYEKESKEFIVFMKDKAYETLEKNNLIQKIDAAKWKDWNYRMTYSDRYKIIKYLNLVEYLKEIDPKEIEKKSEQENILEAIGAKLREQMKDYNEEFLDKVKKNSEYIYENAPKHLKKCENDRKEVEKSIKELEAKLKTLGVKSWLYDNNTEYRTLNKKLKKLSTSIIQLKLILNKTKSEFVKDELENADKQFESNVDAMAQKINDLDLNVVNLKVTNIHDDAKIFKMMITDGEKKFYARSIIAAEFSDLVATHLRFIITERK